MTQTQQRYDEIEWSCNWDGRRVNIVAFDLENQCSFVTSKSFNEVLLQIFPEGQGKYIEITQNYIDKHEEEDEQTERFTNYEFFDEITGRNDKPWMTTESIKEYKELTDKAVYELLHGIINPVILK